MSGLRVFVRGVGAVSVVLAGVGLVRPRGLAAAGGLRPVDDASLPLVVRLASARQGVVGLALLTRSPVDVQRAARLFLPLTVLDALSVGAAVRSGVLRRRSLAMSVAVLSANAAVVASGRR